MAVKKEMRVRKDLRYRERCFPNAADEVFDPKKKGYVPLPIITRKLIRFLNDSEVRVWIYLQLRAGPEFICYPSYSDIVQESGVKSKGTVSKAVRVLEKKGFIRSYEDNGVRRYLIRDPRCAAERLCELGEMTEHELEEINDLRERFKQPLIRFPKLKRPNVIVMTKRA